MLLPKREIVRDRKWLDHCHTLPCVLTHCVSSDILSVVPAHIRHGLGGGISLKPGDDTALPLRADLHNEQHRVGEVRFWREHVTDELLMRALKALAREMYREWKR
jgi:hypothetical protein